MIFLYFINWWSHEAFIPALCTMCLASRAAPEEGGTGTDWEAFQGASGTHGNSGLGKPPM